MKETDRQTRTYLMELFQQHGFHPRTDLGQNFLIDLNLIEFVVRQAQLGYDDVVLEVGTGTAGMTSYLAEQAAAVVSVELDQKMHAIASKVVRTYPNVTLLNLDVLKNKNTLAPEVLRHVREHLEASSARTLKLVANLPYSVATPVVSNLIATDLPWSRMVITIQWELGLRMSAGPGDSHYGALSVWLQAQADVKVLKRLPPNVFWPRPKVESAIVRLTPNPERAQQIVDRPFFQDFVRRLFHHRRKFLRSVLVGMYRKQTDKGAIDAVLRELGHSENARAEELAVPTIVELANRFFQFLQAGEVPATGAGEDATADDEPLDATDDF